MENLTYGRIVNWFRSIIDAFEWREEHPMLKEVYINGSLYPTELFSILLDGCYVQNIEKESSIYSIEIEWSDRTQNSLDADED